MANMFKYIPGVISNAMALINEFDGIQRLNLKFMPSGETEPNAGDLYIQISICDVTLAAIEEKEVLLFNIPLVSNSVPEAQNTLTEFEEWVDKYKYHYHGGLAYKFSDFIISADRRYCMHSVTLGELLSENNTTFELHISSLYGDHPSHSDICIHAIKNERSYRIYKLCNALNIVRILADHTELNREEFKNVVFNLFKDDAMKYLEDFKTKINEEKDTKVFRNTYRYEDEHDSVYNIALDKLAETDVKLSEDSGKKLCSSKICYVIELLLKKNDTWIAIDGFYGDQVIYHSHVDFKNTTRPPKLYSFEIGYLLDAMEGGSIIDLKCVLDNIKNKLNIK